jgi:hypothetical protein
LDTIVYMIPGQALDWADSGRTANKQVAIL